MTARIAASRRGPVRRGERPLTAWRDALIGVGAPLVHIAGGEPTVLKGFADFALGYPAPLRLTTNLWRDPRDWPPGLWERFEYVTLSFHPDQTPFEAFAARASALAALFRDREALMPRLACTIVADPRWIESLPDWLMRLGALGLTARAQYLNRPIGGRDPNLWGGRPGSPAGSRHPPEQRDRGPGGVSGPCPGAVRRRPGLLPY